MKKENLLLLIHVAVALLFFRGAVFQDRLELPCNPNRWAPWVFHATADESAPPAVNTDCALAYYPRRVFATESMRKGDLPLWDPNTFTGQPFLANFQSAILYPINLPLYLLDPKDAMGWFLVIHIALAGVFTFALGSTLGLPAGAAVAAGVAFQLNSFFLTRLGHPTFVATGAWAPLVLVAAIGLLRSPTGRRAALLAASLALATLAGFPQTLIHIYYMTAWFFAAALLAGGASGRRLRVIFFALAATIASFALAAFQLLPTAELLRHSTRAGADLATFLSGTHHPAMLIRMVVPDFFGNPMNENLWSTLLSSGNGYFQQNYVSTINYFGVLPLVIGIYGIATGRNKLFFAGLFLLPLLVIWGTPLARLAYYLPGFPLSRPDRLILLPLLAAAIGFGQGVDRISRASGATRFRLSAALGILALLAFAILLFRNDLVTALSTGRVPPSHVSNSIITSAATTMVIALVSLLLFLFRRRLGRRPFLIGVVLVAGIDLFLFGSRFHLDLPKGPTFFVTPEIETIRGQIGPFGRLIRYGEGGARLLPPGTAALYGIQDVAGINALNLSRYRELMESIEPGIYQRRRYGALLRGESLEKPLVGLIGATGFTVDRSGRLLQGMNAESALPRASLHYDWEALSGKEVLQKVTSDDFIPAETVYLEEDSPPRPLGKGAGSADISLYEPDRVVVDVETDSSALLLLTDAWYPGWEAHIDGEATKLYRADFAFRAVYVPGGNHVVEFRFAPASFRRGGVVSIAALVLTALALAIGSGTGRGRKRDS